MALTKDFISGFSWEITGKIIGQGVGFLVTLVLARLLSPGDFGMLALVNVLIAIASVLIDMGFGSSLVQKAVVCEEHYSAVFVVNAVIGLCLTGATILISAPFARFFGNELLRPIVLATSPIFIITALGSVARTKLYREQNFAALNLSIICGTVVGGIIGILMAVNGFGVWSLVAQSLVNAATVTTYTYACARWFPSARFRLVYIKELWGYSSRIFAATIVGVVFGQLDKLLIGKLSKPAQLGYYYRAKSLESVIQTVLPQSVLSAVFPSLSSLQNDNQRFLAVVKKLFSVLTYISIFLSGLFYLTSHDLILLLFSDKWLPSVSFFRIITLSIFVYPLSALTNAILASKGHGSEFLNLTLLRNAVLLPTYVVLYMVNITAFLYAYAALSIASLFVSIWYVSQVIRMSSVNFIVSVAQGLVICVPLVLLFSQATLIHSSIHLVGLLLMTTSYSIAYLATSLLLRNPGLSALRGTVRTMWCHAKM